MSYRAESRLGSQARIAALVLASALALACEGDPAAPDDEGDEGGGGATSDAADAGACDLDSWSPGCPCEASEGPIECRDELTDGELVMCAVGVQTCEGGRWSACRDVQLISPEELRTLDGLPPVATEALITGPSECSVCDPLCFTNVDHPGPGDLTPERSRDVEFDDTGGGVILESTLGMCAAGDASCTVRRPRGGGTGTPWSLTPDNSEGVTVDPVDGALVLGSTGVQSPGVWVASQDDGTVSRLDPVTGRELARYASARPDLVNGARPWNERCSWCSGSCIGNCPSRTAVDQNFDAYVANRAFGNQGTVTKIAGALRDCRDRNGDGIIQTSRDVDGNGRINLTIGAGEFFGPNDECILWTVPVGGSNGVPRALAIGVTSGTATVGDVWVGLYESRQACRLDPATGASRGCVSISPIYPYGAVADSSGRVWFASRSSGWTVLGSVNPTTMAYTSAPNAPQPTCSTSGTESACTARIGCQWSGSPRRCRVRIGAVVSYGIGIWSSPDFSTRYVYIADSDYNAMVRYNIGANSWSRYDLYESYGLRITPRGVAADENYLWVANYTDGEAWGGSCSRRVYRFNIATMGAPTVYSAPTSGAGSRCFTGVGVTFDGAIWAVGQGSNSAARLAPDRTTWVQTPAMFVSPYTYSDFIGFGLNVFAEPRGHHQFTTDAGPTCGRYRWTGIEHNSMIPAGTSVEFWVRAADTLTDLSRATWVGPFTGVSPISLTAVPGPIMSSRYIDIDVRMSTEDRRVTPRVVSVSPIGYCDPLMYDPDGTYSRTYEAGAHCTTLGATLAPRWSELTWSAATPVGTRIEFQIRAAEDVAGLATATVNTITVPATSPPVNLESFLTARGVPENMPVVQVTARLVSSADLRSTPTLYDFSLDYQCVTFE